MPPFQTTNKVGRIIATPQDGQTNPSEGKDGARLHRMVDGLQGRLKSIVRRRSFHAKKNVDFQKSLKEASDPDVLGQSMAVETLKVADILLELDDLRLKAKELEQTSRSYERKVAECDLIRSELQTLKQTKLQTLEKENMRLQHERDGGRQAATELWRLYRSKSEEVESLKKDLELVKMKCDEMKNRCLANDVAIFRQGTAVVAVQNYRNANDKQESLDDCILRIEALSFENEKLRAQHRVDVSVLEDLQESVRAMEVKLSAMDGTGDASITASFRSQMEVLGNQLKRQFSLRGQTPPKTISVEDTVRDDEDHSDKIDKNRAETVTELLVSEDALSKTLVKMKNHIESLEEEKENLEFECAAKDVTIAQLREEGVHNNYPDVKNNDGENICNSNSFSMANSFASFSSRNNDSPPTRPRKWGFSWRGGLYTEAVPKDDRDNEDPCDDDGSASTVSADMQETEIDDDNTGQDIMLENETEISEPIIVATATSIKDDDDASDLGMSNHSLLPSPLSSSDLSKTISSSQRMLLSSSSIHSCCSTDSMMSKTTRRMVVVLDGQQATYSGPLLDEDGTTPHGTGVLRFKDGTTYLGEIAHGKMHGKGTLYHGSKETSTMSRGIFENNKFIKEFDFTTTRSVVAPSSSSEQIIN